MKPLLPHRYAAEAAAMQAELMASIFAYATANRHRRVWKNRQTAILYGAGMRKLAQIKETSLWSRLWSKLNDTK